LNASRLTASPPDFELKVAALSPAQFLKGLPEGLQFRSTFCIVCLERDQYSHTPYSFMLLRARRKRPGCRRTAEKRNERAPFQLTKLHAVCA
jgi:hypothetical protein